MFPPYRSATHCRKRLCRTPKRSRRQSGNWQPTSTTFAQENWHLTEGFTMATKVIMPQLGESVVEGTVSKWLKKVGDSVQEFEPLLEVSTDKVDTEVSAPA